MSNKIVTLLVLDGFGIGRDYGGNAIALAKMDFYNSILKEYPNSSLGASGEEVGLPKGEDGNSEVGHLNLGAGRIVYQDLPRINMSIADGSFFNNEAFLNASAHVKTNNSSLHLIGLVGSGGVHSNVEHLFALLHFARKQELKKVFLHLFTDGRDSPPSSASQYITQIENAIKNEGIGRIATIVGRYFAMDRDHRWERTTKAYDLLTQGVGFKYKTPQDAITAAYQRNETDEFIQPSVIEHNGSDASSIIKDHDAVIFFNFRVDRPRQLTKMFVLPVFDSSSVSRSDYDPYTERYYKKVLITEDIPVQIPERKHFIKNLYFVTMTLYDRHLLCDVAFPPEKVVMPLSKVIAQNKLYQLHMAESEKERMVTFFFNGLREDPFYLEERIIIASPKVSTYDLKPEMSANEITDVFLQKLSHRPYAFCILNFANPDMLGHTGNINATIEALHTIDLDIKKIKEMVVDKMDGTLIITGDHGNCEEMIDAEGNIDTKHSIFPVPFVLLNNNLKSVKVSDGVLGDVATTILYLLNIPKPQEMTGKNLINTN